MSSSAVLAAQAYSSPRDAALTPRQAEYRVFARVTHRLADARAARERGDPGAYPRLLEALEDNRRLWAVLAADLASDGNGLPERLRADLISLAAFAQAETARVRAGETDARALVEINETIMKGLRARPEAA